MTDTPIPLSLTLPVITSLGLTLLGVVFTLTALIGTVRNGGLHRLFYTLFALIMTFYAAAGWLPALGPASRFAALPVPVAGEVLLCLTLLFHGLNAHFALKARSYSKTVIALVALFIYLTGLLLLSRLAGGKGLFMELIRRPDWPAVALAATALFLLIRLIVAFCFRERGAGWGTVSFLLFAVPPLAGVILADSLEGVPVRAFTLVSLPLLSLWEFIRVFTEGPARGGRKDQPVLGELREQLSESRNRQNSLSTLLTEREGELGQFTARARKVSRGLLPGVIHHDGLWEVTTFFSPHNRSGRRDFFDFYYTYGRKVAGAALFQTPEEPDGALYGALLKKEWAENFMEASSLASLYRRIDSHLQEIFGNNPLTGAVIKLQNDKIEYTGYANPPLFYMNGKLKKSAPLIQDRADQVQDIKSYSLPCGPGDSFLICNDVFLNKTAPVTGRNFGKEELPRAMESFSGKSADMVRELIDRRNKFLGKKDEADILVIYLKRKD